MQATGARRAGDRRATGTRQAHDRRTTGARQAGDRRATGGNALLGHHTDRPRRCGVKRIITSHELFIRRKSCIKLLLNSFHVGFGLAANIYPNAMAYWRLEVLSDDDSEGLELEFGDCCIKQRSNSDRTSEYCRATCVVLFSHRTGGY